MRVLVALSGGVDSSVAAALMTEQGHEVVGATMKLWGGPSDSGCCSVADVEDARRVCQQLGVAHHVFNFSSEFERDVVAPYVEGHARAVTPNPCISCNAHLKFDRFWQRARHLGFDAIATGHHARVSGRPTGRVGGPGAGPWHLRRGRDAAKDQSYVLYMLGQAQLRDLVLPVGEMTKEGVRAHASRLGLRTASKPDSQDVCFISRTGGRSAFLGDRIPVGPGRLVSPEGVQLGEVQELELLTVGQRRGLGPAGHIGPGAGPSGRRYVLDVDLVQRKATLGPLAGLMVSSLDVGGVTWVDEEPQTGEALQVQMSAHGRPVGGHWEPSPLGDGHGRVWLVEPVRRVAAGQAVVLYRPDPDGDLVVGGGTSGG